MSKAKVAPPVQKPQAVPKPPWPPVVRLEQLAIVETDNTGTPIPKGPPPLSAEELARLINYRRACPTIDAAGGAYNVDMRLRGLANLLRGEFHNLPLANDPEVLADTLHFIADALDDCAARLGPDGQRADERTADYYRALLRPDAAPQAVAS
jgi:hypothetical protein